MKDFLKTIVAGALGTLARLIIQKYHPTIIMVTGSVGKTSTKDAIAAALGEKFYMRKSEKSFNSEFGVPLTIIGSKNPWSDPFAWIEVFEQGLATLFLPSHFPKLLVLEVGADRPGDLAKILKIAKPDMVVVTLLPEVPVHVEAYASPQAVREEEFVPALALRPGAPLIYSADDPHAHDHSGRVDAHKVTYGVSEGADVKISEVQPWMTNKNLEGMEATITYKNKAYVLRVAHSFGTAQVFGPAAAIAAAAQLGMSIDDALKGLKTYVPPPGRGRIFAGIKHSTLIDDSYNASPAADEEALHSLRLLPAKARKVAVLGDMLELGRYSKEEHERVGQIAKECVDILITVGTRAIAIGNAALIAGMSAESIIHFENSQLAAGDIADLIAEGDLILVKGSQGVRLERVSKVLLQDKSDATELVRQEQQWLKR